MHTLDPKDLILMSGENLFLSVLLPEDENAHYFRLSVNDPNTGQTVLRDYPLTELSP